MKKMDVFLYKLENIGNCIVYSVRFGGERVYFSCEFQEKSREGLPT